METDQGKLERGRAGGGFWGYLPLAALAVVVGGVFATGLHRSLSFETLIQYQAQLQALVAARPAAMLGLYVLIYVAAVALSLPASAFLTTLGGYLLGWLLGGIVASMAATLGASCIFLVARTSLGGHLLRRAGTRIQSLATGFRKQAFSYLLFLRLMPVMPFWLTNLAAAFFGMRLRSFVLATQVGMLPVSFAFAFAGSGLDRVLAHHGQVHRQCLASGRTDCAIAFDAKTLLTPELMLALSGLAILALTPIAVRYWQSRSQEP